MGKIERRGRISVLDDSQKHAALANGIQCPFLLELERRLGYSNKLN
jgi:hypothetical protein